MTERVWDKFLTPQDKAHLANCHHRAVGFGQKPALLLIDLYRWVYGDEPQPLLEAIDTWPSSCGLAAWDARGVSGRNSTNHGIRNRWGIQAIRCGTLSADRLADPSRRERMSQP